MRRKSYIEEQFTAIKNAPAIAKRAFYTAIALQNATTPKVSYLLIGNTAFTSSYNKANQIIIKLNNKAAARALDSQSTKDIVESMNQYVKTKNITDTDIQAVHKLKSGNIAIYTTNDSKIKKLLENNCWTEVLERKAKLVTETFRVVAHAVCIDSIDLANQNVIMKKIRVKILLQFRG